MGANHRRERDTTAYLPGHVSALDVDVSWCRSTIDTTLILYFPITPPARLEVRGDYLHALENAQSRVH